MTRKMGLIFLARELATEDAATFADEFPGEVCDTAATDWDAVAWTDAVDEIRREFRDLTSEEVEKLRPIYQGTLRGETDQLAQKWRANPDNAA